MPRQRLPKQRSEDWLACATALYTIRTRIRDISKSAEALKGAVHEERGRTPGSQFGWMPLNDVTLLVDAMRACYAEAHQALKGIGKAG